MRSLSRWSAAVALTAGVCVPASAQIISTSVPKDAAGKSEKKWSLHVMVSPYAKWQINDYLAGFDCSEFGGRRGEDCAGTGKVDAKSMLLAGEVAFQLSDSFLLSAGGWVNKIGKETPVFEFRSQNTGQSVTGPINVGQADYGTITEVHGAIFFKDLGLQYGVIMVPHELIGLNSRTDVDGYLVYKPSFGKVALSIGLGSYNSGKFTDVTYGEIPSVSHIAGFATASVRLVKGLSVDGSFWYINKSKGAKSIDVSDSMTRYMIGIGYSL
jgi:hypothetical protein